MTTLAEVEEAIGPLGRYAHDCHAASLALVKSRLLGKSRVARGTCRGVGGQHSWVVVGDDCYDMEATIVDVTAWSYDPERPLVWETTMLESPHRPHRMSTMNMFQWGCPDSGGEEEIVLTPTVPLSDDAEWWLKMFREHAGSLDRKFWLILASHAPLNGWPAAEFLAAMDDTPALAALVPVDLLGMLTDRNPGGLYLAQED